MRTRGRMCCARRGPRAHAHRARARGTRACGASGWSPVACVLRGYILRVSQFPVLNFNSGPLGDAIHALQSRSHHDSSSSHTSSVHPAASAVVITSIEFAKLRHRTWAGRGCRRYPRYCRPGRTYSLCFELRSRSPRSDFGFDRDTHTHTCTTIRGERPCDWRYLAAKPAVPRSGASDLGFVCLAVRRTCVRGCERDVFERANSHGRRTLKPHG